jgi:monoamine oxidase
VNDGDRGSESLQSDVLVVGAGFAGLLAGRELSLRGLSVTVLEGRDRIGGRTWTDERLGRELEMGGTWVHSLQPHVWTELTRYGLELTPSPDPERFLIATEEGLHAVPAEEGFRLLGEGLDPLVEGSREAMPLPFEPWSEAGAVAAVDARSVADRLAELDLGPDARAIVEGFCATGYQGAIDEIGLAHVFHLAALCRWDAETEMEAAATYKIVGGTRALAEAIAADSRADLRLETEVAAIVTDGDQVVARTSGGEEYRASAAIVTVPLVALGKIDFEPPLSTAKRQMVDQGPVSHGVKMWVRVRGEVEPFLGFAGPALNPLTVAQFEYEIDGDSLIVAFGPDSTAISVDDKDAVQEALRAWLPEAEVIDVAGHDWVDDRFSGQTWANLRPGQLTDSVRAMQTPEGGVRLAGADYATGWLGYIDGAMESALEACRETLADLRPSP